MNVSPGTSPCAESKLILNVANALNEISNDVASCAVVGVSIVTVLYKSNDVPAKASPVDVNVNTPPALSIDSTNTSISWTPACPPNDSASNFTLSAGL